MPSFCGIATVVAFQVSSWVVCAPARAAPKANGPIPTRTEATDLNAPGSTDHGVVSLHYSREVGWSGSIAAEIVPKGDSTVITTHNHDGRPELGQYRTDLGEPRFLGLMSALQRSGYDRLPAAGDLRPGAKTTSLGLRRHGEPHPSLRTFETIPPTLGPVMREIEATVEELRKHPARVLRGTAAWSTTRLVRGAPAVLVLTLTNVGREPLMTGNPLLPGRDWNGLRVVFLRPGTGDEKQVDLTAREVRAPKAADTRPVLTLDPGQALRLELQVRPDMSSGRYRTRLEVHDVGRAEPNPARVGGTLALDAGEVTLGRGAWWKFWR